MLIKIYKALRNAGSSEEDALEAASALTEDTHGIRLELERLDKKITLVQWMLGLIIAATVIPLIKALL